MVTRKDFHSIGLGAVLAALASFMSPAHATTQWPAKPVTILVSFPPGGSSDLVGRLLAKELGEILGQKFVVENKPGAAGTVAASALQQAANDGYTLMLSNLTPFNIAPTRFPDTPYDPIKDFTHVSYIGTVNLGLFVRPGLETPDFASFLEKVGAEPGEYDYGTSGVGSWGHVISGKFASDTKTDIVHIPYKGSGPMRQDFRADVVRVMFDAIPQNLPSVEDGDTLALAVAATERLGSLPDTPTFRELGYDIVAENWLGVSAPAGLDSEIATKLDAAMQEAMDVAEVVTQFKNWGIVRESKSSSEFATYVAAQFDDWRPLVEATMTQN